MGSAHIQIPSVHASVDGSTLNYKFFAIKFKYVMYLYLNVYKIPHLPLNRGGDSRESFFQFCISRLTQQNQYYHRISKESLKKIE